MQLYITFSHEGFSEVPFILLNCVINHCIEGNRLKGGGTK